jgi:hypothetical protein
MTRLALRGKRGSLMAQISSPVAHGIGRGAAAFADRSCPGRADLVPGKRPFQTASEPAHAMWLCQPDLDPPEYGGAISARYGHAMDQRTEATTSAIADHAEHADLRPS